MAVSMVQKQVRFAAKPRGCHTVTDELMRQVGGEVERFQFGTANIFLQHTSASLCVMESWDGDVQLDMETVLNRLVPEDKTGAGLYKHSMEGPDDMPAHVKTALMGSSLTIPITDGKLAMGQWQGLWLNEHRDSAGARRAVVTIQGVAAAAGAAQAGGKGKASVAGRRR